MYQVTCQCRKRKVTQAASSLLCLILFSMKATVLQGKCFLTQRSRISVHDTGRKLKNVYIYEILPRCAALVSQVELQHCTTSTLTFNQQWGGVWVRISRLTDTAKRGQEVRGYWSINVSKYTQDTCSTYTYTQTHFLSLSVSTGNTAHFRLFIKSLDPPPSSLPRTLIPWKSA